MVDYYTSSNQASKAMEFADRMLSTDANNKLYLYVKAYLYHNMKEYDKAIADFAKVGDCGYKLFPNYRQLFKVANERCEEMILSVQYIEDPTGYGTGIQK